mmetsp:Transcript_154827/g.288659  ORF Transcript_154827/g.288659 Transcript_154827/m.288659 type:complete len:240 (-) Transcript_154827:82-801(-)
MGNDVSICSTDCSMEIRQGCAENEEETELEYSIYQAPVFLNVYHLDENWSSANQISTQVLGLGGAFHCGVEVFNTEYFYSASGIVADGTPRKSDKHIFYKSILMGETKLSTQEVKTLIKRQRHSWTGACYDLLDNNCCNYADVLCQELVGTSLPTWVSNLPRIASAAASTLEGALDVKQFTRVEGQTPRRKRRSCPKAPCPPPPASVSKNGDMSVPIGGAILGEDFWAVNTVTKTLVSL